MNIENITNEIKAWVEKNSGWACEYFGSAYVIGVDELAEFINELVQKEKTKLEGCVVVPVEPTDEIAVWILCEHDIGDNLYQAGIFYKELVVKAARSGK